MIDHLRYCPPQQALWSGRADADRLFQCVHCIDLTQDPCPKPEGLSIAIIGFACEAGVIRNQGRPGAKSGPKAFRSALANLPLHTQNIALYDLGDIVCNNDDLESAQLALAQLVSIAHENNLLPIVLGGGHEIAYGHYQGLKKAQKHQDLSIINFDAHFDLRPLLKGNQGSSGTPFLQIAEDRKQAHLDFNYHCIGIQPNGNTPDLYDTAHQINCQYINAESIHTQPQANTLTTLQNSLHGMKDIYLTVCLDVFAQAYAPGVSAPQPLGLTPWQVLPLIHEIIKTGKVLSIDFAELSPPLDEQDKTAKLAAHLVGEMLHSLSRLNP